MRIKFYILILAIPFGCFVFACDSAPSDSVAPIELPEINSKADAVGVFSHLQAQHAQSALSATLTQFERQAQAGSQLKYWGSQSTAPPTGQFRMPGEFEANSEILIAYPSAVYLEDHEYLVDLIANVSLHTKVTVVTGPEWAEDYILQDLLSIDLINEDFENPTVNFSNINFIELPLNSMWMRDFGPIYVNYSNGDQAIVDFRYYRTRILDDGIPVDFANRRDLPLYTAPLSTEGGNILSNGAGKCLSTDTIFTREENLDLSAVEIENIYRDYLGCEELITVSPLVGEGTGHIDMYITLTGTNNVLVGQYTLEQDEVNRAIQDTAANILEYAGFEVTRIPMPSRSSDIYRSYTNAIATDTAVFVPIYPYEDTYEDSAIEIFEAAYPNREIVPIDATNAIYIGGAVHCTTMNVPAPDAQIF